MNAIERRVTEALQTYGEKLEMTTQDINRLEEELEQKRAVRQSASTQRRNRIFQGAVAACAVTGVVLGALALRSDPPPPVPAGPTAVTTNDLAGVWSYDSWLWTFHADGRLTQSNRPYDPDAQTDSGATSSTYTRTPDGFIQRLGAGSQACDVTWKGTISPEGRLRATPTEESGPGCEAASGPVATGAPEVWEFTRVSPVSTAGADLALLWPTTAPQPLPNVAKVYGTWLLRGSGTLLSIDPSGDYAVRTFDTLDQPQTGKAAVPRAGSLVFTPTSTPSCTARYESVVTRNATMDATSAAGSCARLGGTTDTWIRIN
jgi:hypothetical protein